MSIRDGGTCSASGAVICSRGHRERWGRYMGRGEGDTGAGKVGEVGEVGFLERLRGPDCYNAVIMGKYTDEVERACASTTKLTVMLGGVVVKEAKRGGRGT